MTNLDNLTKEEREAVAKILEEMSSNGVSEKMTELINSDYDEIPVDIATFLHENQYLGNGLTDADGRFTLFPYWEEKLKDIFPDSYTTKYNTLIFTGGIGLGKSTIAVICLLYLLYRLLCLKDPYLYYGLQPIDKLSISLMNITLENAKGVALDKMNQMILSSSWFMSHGQMSGISNLVYMPDKHIELITASSNNQVIGRCLDEDTEIVTIDGIFKIKDLLNKDIRVKTLDNSLNIVESNTCTIQQTAISQEAIEITLENGSIIKCTPEHKLMLIDGTYKEAQYLTENDELFELSEYDIFIQKIINTRGQWGIADSEYYEGHHIIPKCLGGKGTSKSHHENIIRLYPDEHYIAHKLLLKKYPHNSSIAKAFSMMAFPKGKTQRNTLSADEYARARCLVSEALQGQNNPMYGKTPWNKGLTKNTDARIAKAAAEAKGRNTWTRGRAHSKSTKEKLSAINKKRYMEHPESFSGRPPGMVCITNGNITKYIDPDIPLPDGYWKGATHKKSKKYQEMWTIQKRQKWSKKFSGCNNPNYKHGEKQSGGRNGHATIRYFFKDKVFESRKELIGYLNSQGHRITSCAIRRAIRGIGTEIVYNKYKEVFDNLSWELKDENKEY